MPIQPHARPGEQTLQLDLPLVLPGIDSDDGCIARLEERLEAQSGIRDVHLARSDAGQPLVCLHYDPNLVPLEKLERLARDYGTEIVQRFKHENIPIKGMDCASCAASIEHVVKRLPGVLRVSVNYAVEKMKVEYDSTLTDRARIAKAVRSLGYRIQEPIAPGLSVPRTASLPLAGVDTTLPTLQERAVERAAPHEGHDHTGHDHKGHDHKGHDHKGHDHEAHDHASHESHDDHAGHAHEAPDEHEGHHHGDEGHEAHGDDEDGGHEGHVHTEVDPNANWFVRNPELSMSLLSGLLAGLAFLGQRFWGLPEGVAIGIYVLSYVAGGYDLARHTVPTMLRGRFDVEFLMIVAAIGAAVLGEWFEGALLLFLFSFGHALEHFAMERARNAIQALGSITPKAARVRRSGQELEIAVEALQIGDVAIVRPGDRIAVDGKITQGRSSVDQSPITGESVPVEKQPGEGVFAGSINGDGALEVEVSKLSQDTTMARVIEMVEEAQTQKSPTQTFTDKFEKVFVPCVLVIVVLAAVVPPLLNLLPWKVAVLRALSTLVAASPCALALATPSAVLAGIAQAARHGVLIKGGVHLENLGALNAIALDKTGTITRGRPEVTDIVPFGMSEAELLALAGGVETRSSHPLAQAVVRRAQEQKLALPETAELQNLQGRGVQTEVGAQLVRIGNLRMFEEAQIAVPDEARAIFTKLGEAGKPTMMVGVGEKIVGVLAMADQLRPETPAALKQLKEAGIKTLIMLTGDNERVAKAIAANAGVTDFRADLLPENKVTAIQELLKQHGRVAMVGDGVNDAPALANATVVIAMGAGGTDVALETADVALMADDISKLPYAVALSRMSRAIIKQNLWVSLGVIALLVPSTLLGVAGISLAVILHEGSTLLVVANALRLLSFKPDITALSSKQR